MQDKAERHVQEHGQNTVAHPQNGILQLKSLQFSVFDIFRYFRLRIAAN